MTNGNRALREHLLALLRGGAAHIGIFAGAVGKRGAANLENEKRKKTGCEKKNRDERH